MSMVTEKTSGIVIILFVITRVVLVWQDSSN